MSAEWLLYSYLIAAAVALLVLVVFRVRQWYWHALSVVAGITAGLLPPFGGGGDLFYLIAGTACLFLCLWGFGGLLFFRDAR